MRTPELKDRSKEESLPSRGRSKPGSPAWWAIPAMALLGLHAPGDAPAQDPDDKEAALNLLGFRLFDETRFANPGTDFPTSCTTCHIPPGLGIREHGYAEGLKRSIVPLRREEGHTMTLRNAPTLLNAGPAPFFNMDGRFGSLEDLMKAKLTGRMFGWFEAERERVFEEIDSVIIDEDPDELGAAQSYANLFRDVYDVELKSLDPGEVTDWVARALAQYVLSIRPTDTSPYDAFLAMNRIPTGPNEGEPDPKGYAERVLIRIANQMGRLSMKLTKGFDDDAFLGYRIFFSTEKNDQSPSVGNCVACHIPPAFTDYSLHNMGVSQMEYDAFEGEGSFAKLPLDRTDDAVRSSQQFLKVATAGDTAVIDLGHWDVVDLQASTLRRDGEGDGEFLDRMIATFKTPPLREIELTAPYMHNGAYATLEEVVAQKVRASTMAKAGLLRNADPEILAMDIGEEDIVPLVAFLKSLRDVDPDGFRDLLIHPIIPRNPEN